MIIQAVSLMTPHRFHSPTRSPASISPLGDQMSQSGRTTDGGGRPMGSTDIAAVVPTRGGVARASQIWQGGGDDRIFDVLAPGPSTTEGGELMRQVGKLLKTPATTHDGEARLLEGGKDPARESSVEGGKWPGGWKSRRTGPSGPPPRRPSTTSPRPHTPTDERPVEKRATEQARSRSWIHPTSARGGSEQQQQRSPRGSAQGASATSRVFFATHLDATVTDATGSAAAGVRCAL